MTQSLILIGLFLCVLISLPFLIERIKKHYGLGGMAGMGSMGTSRVVSALAVGPQQKVITVEVGPPQARVWLVLGVTQQSIQCLHSLPVEAAAAQSLAAVASAAASPPLSGST